MRGHIISKIREASYFLKQMEACSEKPEEFRFNLSAFLTSSRSAAQYLLEEAKRRGKEGWYENYVSNSQYMGYFRDKRNFNIHEQNVPITRDVNLSISIIGTKLVVDKKEKKYFSPSKESAEVKPDKKVSNFEFTDYPGKEDILTLSTKYLEELKEFVRAAQDNNVI
ncbi:MAG: hypothetical protein WBC52_04285 [Candidatus Omnitrophota bacterium]